VNVHVEMPKEVNKVFVDQPSDLGRGGSDPPGLLGYFGLAMVNLGRPPLPPNMPYCQPFNYHEYVKDFAQDVHVRVFKVAIKGNGESEDAKFATLFSLPSKILCLTSVTITWESTQILLL